MGVFAYVLGLRVCSPMCEHMEARSQCLMSLSKALHIIFHKQGLSLNLDLDDVLARLATHWEVEILLFHIPMLELPEHTTTPGFYMGLGIQTQFFMLL